MKTIIADLLKTDHQLYKQWNYGISDKSLYPIACRIEAPNHGSKKIILVLPSFLDQHNIARSKSNVLIIVLNGRNMNTSYYCDKPNYIFKKEKNVEFQIIY
jgi:hypothetical protein